MSSEPLLSLSDIAFANRDAEPASFAEWFLDHGIYVFPVHNKEPAVPFGTSWKDYRAADAHRLRNFGVPLSATLGVLDTDNAADEAWVRQQLAHGSIPVTPFVVETARGCHRYFRLHGAVPKTICRDGHVVEFRNAGQYVVGPGSRHPSGKYYTPRSWSWRWEELPFFPRDFLFDDGSTPRATGLARPGTALVLPDIITEKCRHDMLHKLMRSLAAHGVPCDVALHACRAVNATRCRPPLPDAALDRDVGRELGTFLRRAYRQKDRANFTRTPKQGWALAGALLTLGLGVVEAVTVVQAIDPMFDPESSV